MWAEQHPTHFSAINLRNNSFLISVGKPVSQSDLAGFVWKVHHIVHGRPVGIQIKWDGEDSLVLQYGSVAGGTICVFCMGQTDYTCVAARKLC